MQVLVGVQFGVALAWSLASNEGAAGVYRSVGSDSRAVSETVVENHSADVAEAEQETLAGTEEEHHAEGECILESKLVAEQEGQGALVQAGIPEGGVAQWAGGTAVEASAAVVGKQESGPYFEQELLAVAACGGTVQSVVLCSQLRLQVGQGGVAWGCS